MIKEAGILNGLIITEFKDFNDKIIPKSLINEDKMKIPYKDKSNEVKETIAKVTYTFANKEQKCF